MGITGLNGVTGLNDVQGITGTQQDQGMQQGQSTVTQWSTGSQGVTGTQSAQGVQMETPQQGTMHAGYRAWQEETKQSKSTQDEKTRDDVFEDVGKEFELTGSTAEFFSSVVDDFEYTRGFAKDVKKCKWYKVKVDNFDVLCNMSNYNKYTVAYYPMINYYPYICRKGYFMIGFKYDENGVVKYVTYAIPGYKDKKDQPYGGKTGFVTWCPEFKNSVDGHWIMFYDFQASKVLVPIV